MRKIKFLVASLLFCAMSYAGYMGYERVTMSEAERFMQANVEALTSGESGSGFRYPDRSGRANYCTLYVYIKGSIKIEAVEERKDLEATGEYTKTVISGLKDRCPSKGNGCNPYSCQQVPY